MSTHRFCGRDLPDQELEAMRALCADREGHPARSAIARGLCEAIGWRDQLGRLKETSARVALVRTERAGLICLPAPRDADQNGKMPRFVAGQAQAQLTSEIGRQATRLAGLGAIEVAPVSGRGRSATWNELVATHHHLR